MRRRNERRTKPIGEVVLPPIEEDLEWVGGRVVAPFWVTRPRPRRPEMLIWLELPTGVLLALELGPPRSPLSLGASLEAAMLRPAVGPPRRPARVRVVDEASAREVREALPGVVVQVAPIPEVDEVVERLSRSLPGDEDGDADSEPPSYLEGGRVSPAAVAELFAAASGLYEAEPWQVAGDDQVLRLDIPSLAVRGMVVSIIGASGERRGLCFFETLDHYERFVDNHELLAEDPEATIELGGTLLALEFTARDELPEEMQREIEHHGWALPVGGEAPVVAVRENDGFVAPHGEREVRIVGATAVAVTNFLAEHGSIFSQEEIEPLVARVDWASAAGMVTVFLSAPFVDLGARPIEEVLAERGISFGPESGPDQPPRGGRRR